MKTKTFLFAMIFLFIFNAQLQADNNTTLVGQLPYGTSYALTKSGDHLFVGNGETIQIYDDTNPENLLKIGEVLLNGSPRDIVIQGSLAFVANNFQGLSVLDISDPSHPTLLSELAIHGLIQNLDIAENLVFLATEKHGIYVVDVSNPAEPMQVSNFLDDLFLKDVLVRMPYVYVSAGTEGLVVLDATDIVNPSIIASYDLESTSYLMDIEAEILYMANSQLGIVMFDISNPALPVFIGQSSIISDAYGLDVQDGIAYATMLFSGMSMIDLTTPTAPILLGGFYAASSGNMRIVANGNYAYLGNVFKMCAIDVSNVDQMEQVFVINAGASEKLCTSDNYAYVTGTSHGLQIVDISNPEAMLVVSHSWDFGDGTTLTVNNDMLFMGYSNQLRIIDVSNPAVPELVSLIYTPVGVIKTKVEGQHLFILDYNSFIIYDLTNVSNPIEIGNIEIDYNRDFAIEESLAYIVSVFGLSVVDISTLPSPQLLSFTQLISSQSLAVKNSFVYVGNDDMGGGSTGLVTIDATNPVAPIIIGQKLVGELNRNIEVVGNYLYLGNWSNDLLILDISDLDKPELVGFHHVNWVLTDLSVKDDLAFIAVISGIEAVRNDLITGNIDIIENNLRLKCYPNPTNDRLNIDIPAEAQGHKLTLIISDMTGSAVGRYEVISMHETIKMSSFPGGVYLVSLMDGDQLVRKSVVVNINR